MAILHSTIKVELREVALNNKPQVMLDASPKATVPVLITNDGVLDESLDIMHWALQQHDPDNWLDTNHLDEINSLIEFNDHIFKTHLDHYKYADRFPENSQTHYREQAEVFLQQLEEQLHTHAFVISNKPCLADIALFPFIRQFAYVDIDWFRHSPYAKLFTWLNYWLNSEIFQSTMQKHPLWTEHQPPIIF